MLRVGLHSEALRRMNLVNAVLVIVLSSCYLAGCPATLSGDHYPREQARRAQRVEFGMVEYVRFVVIEGTKTAVGPAAGAAVGGIAGRSVGDGAVRDIATVAGGVAGGIAGAATEEAVTRRQGIEVTVRLDNGKIIAVVQEVSANVRFSPGDRVRVLTLGNTTRVIQ